MALILPIFPRAAITQYSKSFHHIQYVTIISSPKKFQAISVSKITPSQIHGKFSTSRHISYSITCTLFRYYLIPNLESEDTRTIGHYLYTFSLENYILSNPLGHIYTPQVTPVDTVHTLLFSRSNPHSNLPHFNLLTS